MIFNRGAEDFLELEASMNRINFMTNIPVRIVLAKHILRNTTVVGKGIIPHELWGLLCASFDTKYK